MSQVDNKNASAGKRARTDGGRREDDWTCPSCGNVNFSFRTTCNMRNCTQSRPADHNTKLSPKSVQARQHYTSAGYMGPMAPSSMYLGASPYGSSVFSGSAPYDRSFSSGSPYHYGYDSRLPLGSPYGPLRLSGPPHYTSGSMFGSGGMYGVPPMMDKYNFGFPVGYGPMGPRNGAFPEESSPKKSAGRENDWKCPKCGNNNFSFRDVCNMRKCNTPRPASMSENSKGSKPKMPEGSWKCKECNNLNYPFRTKCNRQNCGAEKPPELNKTSDDDDLVSTSVNSKGSKPKMPEGSWKCERCNNINYPFRTKCNRQNCGAEKPPELNQISGEDDQVFRNLLGNGSTSGLH